MLPRFRPVLALLLMLCSVVLLPYFYLMRPHSLLLRLVPYLFVALLLLMPSSLCSLLVPSIYYLASLCSLLRSFFYYMYFCFASLLLPCFSLFRVTIALLLSIAFLALLLASLCVLAYNLSFRLIGCYL